MLSNYLKIAWRNISRHKIYSAVNILGLSLGICSSIVIYTLISYELSFDTFHPGMDRIYRIMGDVKESTGDKLHFARLPLVALPTARAGLSGLELIAGIIPFNTKISVAGGNGATAHFDGRIAGTNYITTALAEPQYFGIFRYDWLAGNAATALEAPFAVVLTQSRARQYFGAGPLEKMVGREIVYEDSLVVHVSGIVKDWGGNTDLAFTDLISFSTLPSSFLRSNISRDSWGQGDMSTWIFAKLPVGQAPARVNGQLASLVKVHATPGTKLALWLEPLSDLHFNADVIENPVRTAHMPTLYGLMGVAVFILILAVINFINLSTAQSIRRAKEVGIRKVLGGSRMSLIFQFLSETFVLTLVATALAVLLVSPVLAGFRSFIPQGVSFHFFAPSTLTVVLTSTLATTLLAGLYPAKVLSSHLPALSLKGTGAQRGGEKWLLRKGLIVFQFSVSLVFIIGSIVIADQLRYTRNKDLGFTADAIVTVETPRGDSLSKIAVLAERVRQIPAVSKAALQWLSPMTENARGMKLKFRRTDPKDFWVTQVAGDENFIPLYQMKLLAGRNLEPSDKVKEFVINKSLSRLIGGNDPEQSLGKILYWNDKPYPVVGVVSDFHTSSLHDPITPLCVINRPEREGSLAIRLVSKGKGSGEVAAVLSQIKKAWGQLYPAGSFNYRFYDESLALLYEKDRQAATLMNVSMAITIFISCIGLFGLALFTAEKRAKEISIRKVMGASVANIAVMLGRDFVLLVVISIFIASPVAWYFMDRWLQGFAYRVPIHAWVFIVAGLAAILTALMTTGFQAVRAAIVNPVKNLHTK